MTPQERVIQIARQDLGYHEGGNNWNKFAEILDKTHMYNGGKQNQPWCDIYVDSVFYRAFGYDNAQHLLCQPDYSCGAGCYYSMNYYKAVGRFHSHGMGHIADQVFYGTSSVDVSHTGILEQIVDDNTFIAIEGNYSDQVMRVKRKLSECVGFGCPDWSMVGGIDNDTDNLQFNEETQVSEELTDEEPILIPSVEILPVVPLPNNGGATHMVGGKEHSTVADVITLGGQPTPSVIIR